MGFDGRMLYTSSEIALSRMGLPNKACTRLGVRAAFF